MNRNFISFHTAFLHRYAIHCVWILILGAWYAGYLYTHTSRSHGSALGASVTRPAGDIQRDISKWEKIASKSPDYRDAHLTLFYLYLETGNADTARRHLAEVKRIDPNNDKIGLLESQLDLLK